MGRRWGEALRGGRWFLWRQFNKGRGVSWDLLSFRGNSILEEYPSPGGRDFPGNRE